MLLDQTTATQLGWEEIRKLLSQEATTPQGRAACLALAPSADPDGIRRAQDRLRQLSRLLDEAISPPIESIDDVQEELRRARKGGVLSPEAVRSVGQAMVVSSRVRHFLMEEGHRAGGALTDLARGAHELYGVGRDLVSAFDESGVLRDSASPELGPRRKTARTLAEGIRARLERMLRDPKVAACLQEPYITQRADRHVLPVRADAHEPFSGIVHDTSHSGATLFVEPAELVEDGNRLKIARAAVVEEERRILAEYSGEVAELADCLEANLQTLAEFDLVLAAVRLGRRMDGQLIDVRGAGFHLLEARHPLMLLSTEPVVPNDIRLADGQRCLVVTGPNAGGKTVALKTVGLVSIMAQAGLAVPVGEGSRISLVGRLHAVIGDAQDIRRGLSTFSAHIESISWILRQAGPDTMVLLDELAADTDPRHGAALAGSILGFLADRGAVTVVTTHFEELKRLAYHDQRFANASVGFDMKSMEPTYALHPDTPGRSLTLDIARRLGVFEEVLENAARQLDGGEQQIDQMLANLERERQYILELREELARRAAEADLLAREHQQAADTLLNKKKELLAAGRSQLLAELARIREEVADLIEDLRRNPSMKAAVHASKRVKEITAHLQSQATNEAALQLITDSQAEAVEPAGLKPGDRVLVAVLGGKEGEVSSVDRRGGMVGVRLGALQTRVALEQVRKLPGSAAGKHQAKTRRRKPDLDSPVSPLVRSPTNTLDLRGLHVDEALEAVDKFLDQLFSAGQSAAFLIHGHGTGALKEAIRDSLRKSPYPSHFRVGAPEEGGDGVTVVKLK